MIFPIQRLCYIMPQKGKRLLPAAQAFKTFVLEQAKDFICQSLIADHH
jgi:hypothetical protein